MFYYIDGMVSIISKNLAVIDVNGVGYACNTSQNTITSLKEGSKARLYTYIHVREDVFDIYGFYDEEELNFFKLLISISGVGPKAALSILSVAPTSTLALSIITGDEKIFTGAQGIGKKIAQRIVLELRDKMAKEQLETAKSSPVNMSSLKTNNNTQATGEAISALMVLGYSQGEAVCAMEGLDTSSISAEELIRQCLKKLSKQ